MELLPDVYESIHKIVGMVRITIHDPGLQSLFSTEICSQPLLENKIYGFSVGFNLKNVNCSKLKMAHYRP